MYILNYTLEDALKDREHEGYADGEAMFPKLVSRLINEGKTEILKELSENKEKRDEYYRLYGMIN